MKPVALIIAALILACAVPAFAQQQPIVTTNPGAQKAPPKTSSDRYVVRKDVPAPSISAMPNDYTTPWTASGAPEAATLNSHQAAPALGPDGKPLEQAPVLNKVFDALPRDIQDQIMAEATSVQQQCASDATYPFYHDCECIGAKFLDARVQNPDIARTNLSFKLRAECVNTPGIAGYNYGYCMKQASYMMPNTAHMSDKQRDEYCKCFARTNAKLYAQAPDPSYKHIMRLQMNSFNSCLTGSGATTP